MMTEARLSKRAYSGETKGLGTAWSDLSAKIQALDWDLKTRTASCAFSTLSEEFSGRVDGAVLLLRFLLKIRSFRMLDTIVCSENTGYDRMFGDIALKP